MLAVSWLVIVPVAAALSGAPAVATQEPSFSTAAALQQAGELEAAAAEYRRFLDTHPASIEARSNLGVVLVRLGRYEEAIAAYRSALQIDAANPTVRMNLGLAFYKADQLGDAIDAFTRVLAAEPDNVRARYLAADCQLRLGKPAEAIALLTPIEAAHADDPALAYLLGMAYLKAKDVDRGQVLLDRILRRGDSAQARVMMGVAKRGAGDLKAAVEDLKQAVALDPDLPGVHAMYAQALLEAGNPDIARAEFEAELSRNPLDFETNLNLGVLLKNEQDFDRAVHHFTRALGVRPGDLATRFQIASVSLARRDVQAAAGMLEAIIAEAPSFLEAHVALATAYYRLQRKGDGDRERAIVDRLTREREAKEQARTGRVKPGG